MAKIVFKNGKPHLRIGAKNVPIAEEIKVPVEFEGKQVKEEMSVYMNGEAIIKSFKIDGVMYSSDIMSTPEKEDDPKEDETISKPKLLSGRLFLKKKKDKEWYVFESDRKIEYNIMWRRYPDAFRRINKAVVDAIVVGEDITKIMHENNEYTDIYARAPYNFVPLNDRVIMCEEHIRHHTSHNNLLSGYLEFSITTQTPLFIRGNKDDFFRFNSVPVIPGSSIRGMIRNLIEIAGFGKLTPNERYEDERMYYRAMADMAVSLREKYKNEIDNDIEAGYLSYSEKTKKYHITPSRGFDRVPVNGKFQYRIAGNNIEIHSGWMQNKKKNWVVLPPLPGTQSIQLDSDLVKSYEKDKNRNIDFDILEAAKRKKYKNTQLPNGVPVFFKRENGSVTSFGHTKNYRLPYSSYISNHIPTQLQNKEVLDLADCIFGTTKHAGKVFFEDCVAEESVKLLSPNVLKILGTPNPTTFQHYLEQKPLGKDTAARRLKHWDDNNANIRGHKLYWHRKTNETATPSHHRWTAGSLEIKKDHFEKFLIKEKNVNDPGAYLSDLSQKGQVREEADSKQEIKIIIEGDLSKVDPDLRNHIIDFVFLEPHKAKDWGIKKPQNTIAKCADANTEFKNCRLRFENLTTEELGALLFVLDLPKACCHKLGMGKPLGLGSVKIEVEKVVLTDRQQRYTRLFNDDFSAWNTGERTETNFDQFKNDFAQCIDQKLYNKEKADENYLWNKLWENDRLTQLKTLLQFEQDEVKGDDWLERTRYMSIDDKEFKSRPVLPYPNEVIMKETYKK